MFSLPAHLKHWFMPYSQSIWRDMEAIQVSGRTLYDWLIGTLRVRNKDKSLSPTILASLSPFHQLVSKAPQSTSLFQLPIPLTTIKLLTPILTLNRGRQKALHKNQTYMHLGYWNLSNTSTLYWVLPVHQNNTLPFTLPWHSSTHTQANMEFLDRQTLSYER